MMLGLGIGPLYHKAKSYLANKLEKQVAGSPLFHQVHAGILETANVISYLFSGEPAGKDTHT